MVVNPKEFSVVPFPARGGATVRMPKREEIPLPEQPKREAVSLLANDTEAKQSALYPKQSEQPTEQRTVDTQPDAEPIVTDSLTNTEVPAVPVDMPAEQGNKQNTDTEQMQALLDAWKEAAEEQQKATIDRAVEQAVTELENVWQNTQGQLREQAESISLQERQAMDNAVLYAELRGDRGGIGQEQYSSIQNTAAQNRFAVQQAQTQLSSDIARQIEDLRVQGEFEKADAMLEITQDYLEQLLTLEQWATEFQFSQEEFAAQLEQWMAEYELSLRRLGLLP